MPDVPENVKYILVEAYKEYLEEVLDDPSWIQGEATTFIPKLRETAEWLGLDFDKLLKERSDFERLRFFALENGGSLE